MVDDRYFATVTEAIRNEVRRLLTSREVAAVVGWQGGRRVGTAAPAIISDPAQVETLIFSPACVNNLALYLTKAKPEVAQRGRLAMVVKGCDLKGVMGLLGESQLQRQDVHLIGVACSGVFAPAADRSAGLTAGNIARKCRTCTVRLPAAADTVVGTLPELPELEDQEGAKLARLEAMTPAERWSFWKGEFSRCIRCMACRQVCPFCYCQQCLCDRNRPQAVEGTPRPAANMAWHLVRAMHLAGRCAGCAECERVCPMEIPLNLLNRRMAEELKLLYGHEAGMEPQEQGPLTSYDEKDDQSFIK
jgi:ferredoxin